jgi:type IV pilus assembly protein PilN
MIRINLLTEKKRKKKSSTSSQGFYIILGASVLGSLLVMGTTTYVFKSQVSGLKVKIAANEKQVETIKKNLEQIEKLKATNNELKQRSAIIETLRKNQSVPVRVLDEVSNALPDGVWLNSLSYKDNAVIIEGFAFTNENIVSYVENLKRSGSMTEVYLDESKETEIGKIKVYRFKLNFKVKG